MKTSYLSCTSADCRKTFRNQSSLDSHIQKEHSEGEGSSLIGYRCKKCKRVLGTKQSLKEHTYTHTGQKPYKCNEPGCEKIFRQSSQLSYHKKIHSEVKKYLEDCGSEEKIDKNMPGFIVEHKKEDWKNSCEVPLITVPQVNIKLPNIFS